MAEYREHVRKLRVLMWKQFHLRKSRWILSLLELLLPILIVWAIGKTAAPFIANEGMIYENATRPHAIDVNRAVSKYQSLHDIIYTPKRKPLDDLMAQYSELWMKMTLNTANVTGVDDEEELELMIRNAPEGFIGIVFEEFSAITSADGKGRLAYTLRSSQDLITNEVYLTVDKSGMPHVGPVHDDPYLIRGFVSVQIVLNEAVLRYRKEGAAYENTILNPFPYPEYANENPARSNIPEVVCFIVLMTALIFSVPLITSIIEEKISGIKELMKIVGVNEWLIWLSWFLHAFIFSFVTYTIITYLLQYEFSGPNSAAIRNVNPSVLWSCILLYCIANIAFCFTFVAIFHQTTIASSMYVLTLICLAFVNNYLTETRFTYLRKVTCLLPSAAFHLGFRRIKYTETHDMYLGWNNLFSSSSSTLSLGYTFMMMIFDTFLYSFLAYYINAINPGKFGARKSPFFIFNPLKMVLKKNQAQELVNLEDPPIDKYIEKAPSNLEASIKIKDLHKNFGSVYAVKGVNLNVYKGEITALLGHNGAGKTTTLAMLTGLIKPTEGSIIYKDKLDVLKKMDEFRQNLGMCAQEDRLFPYLSALDHLLFFGQLKGASRNDALQEAKEYMRLMEIEDKASSLVATLSGGMKRKLCLSIALMGKAETLILDEPTSGLDVESRRKLWDLLLELRGSRTIILTTHHMEEADVLGDRIAIMHHGTIVCHGTSLFLKKSYNTGYQLTITKREDVAEDQLTNIIQNSGVPDVSLESLSPREVVYKLPLTETSMFPNIFKHLEKSRDELGIESIGVSCTTMEQVFLKVGGVSVYDPVNSSRKGSTVTDGGTVSKLVNTKRTGPILIVQQIIALMKKKFLYVSRNWLNLFFRVVLPTIFLCLFVRSIAKFDHPAKSLQIDYSLYPNTKLMVQNTSESWPIWKSFEAQLEPYGIELIVSEGENIVEGLLEYGRKDLGSYKHDIILAMEMSENNFTLLYNLFAIHSLPLGLNVLANHVIQYRDNKSTEFVMVSHPISKITKNQCAEESDNRALIIFIWFVALAFYTIDLNTYFVTSINTERLDGFKHIQLMSNVSPITYWLSNFIFDYVFFFVIVLSRIIIIKLSDDDHEFLKMDHHFAVFMLIMALFIGSSLLFTYVLSYLSNSKDGSYILIFLLNIVGAIVVSFIYMVDVFLGPTFVLENIGYSILSILYKVTRYIVLLLPPMNYSLIFIKLSGTWFDYKSCRSNCTEHPPNTTCWNSYLDFPSPEHPNGMLTEVLFLIFDLVLYSVLLSVIQLGYFEKLVNLVLIRIYGSSVRQEDNVFESGDTDVQLEKANVDRLMSTSSGDHLNSENMLVAHGLRKNFIKLFRPFTAVADVNFTVKPGECFGLLGVNGAGKSTTFRMLTGDLLPTKGSCSIMNYRLDSSRTEYLSRAGYCAQSNCFLEELSGREMLSLVASLRGINSSALKDLVDRWLGILGLEDYQNQRCGNYSGGNKRKLCTAMSLIGDPMVVFLDEPTSGVDPVARRRLYAVMEQSRESGQAVVLTSHSMEECENLCDRLTILVKGRMQCIGTAQHLKQTYAQGFSVLVKISDTATEDALCSLKRNIEKEFNEQCVLKDEHRTQLYYQITNVNFLWSTLFEKMEKLKESNKNILEDYSVSDTSLEEVFISFAKN